MPSKLGDLKTDIPMSCQSAAMNGSCKMIGLNSQRLSLLRRLTLSILDSQTLAHTLRSEVLDLTEILLDSGSFRISREDLSLGETRTENGEAISPTMAAMCAREYVRTVQFLRGTHAAILEIRKQFPDRPARVLEIGCGPIGTLVVPLMTIFSPQEALFTLLDIHSDSIDSAKQVVETLGLTDSIAGWETMDASQYRVDSASPPDVILMEIMRGCLEGEPQVAITRHLLAQVPHALLVPEEVRIDLNLVDQSREFQLNALPDDGGIQRDRIPVSSIFVLNRETVHSWKSLSGDQLPGSIARIPDGTERRYHPKLFTNIRVYQNHVLRDYSCSLSLPRNVPIKGKIEPGDLLQFHYELGKFPQLRVEVVAKSNQTGNPSERIRLGD